MARKHETQAVIHFEPKTASQELAVAVYDGSEILFLLGPAGTGKTHTAVALAAAEVLSGRKKTLLLCRPAVECSGRRGKGLGFLPGTVDEKMAPYARVLKKLLAKVTYRFPDSALEVLPLEHLQGDTFEDAVALLDECQNADLDQLRMFLSRLGRNSRLVLSGDPDQSCIASTQPDYVTDLDFTADRLDGLPGVSVIDFPAQQTCRHPLVSKVLTRLLPPSDS